MRNPRVLIISVCLAAFAMLAFSACSINVAKNDKGDDKKVDIETPVGGIHVSKNADVRDTGLEVYPGARERQKDDSGDEKSANVNISTPKFGLRVVAIEYESDDSPDKVIAYYKDQLKKFGNVLECHTSKHDQHVETGGRHDGDSGKPVACEGDNTGPNIELKVGTEDNQHIVAIEPKGKKTDFALVMVRTRGDETI